MFSPESDDPLYTKPYLDSDEWRDGPVRHRYVHGGFDGTEARFSMYFPEHERYGGRFFQPLMAVSGNENTAAMAMGQGSLVGYAVESGAYLVESNLGRRSMFPGNDPTVPAFRASAAVRGTRASSRPRCTARTGPTATSMAAAAAHSRP